MNSLKKGEGGPTFTLWGGSWIPGPRASSSRAVGFWSHFYTVPLENGWSTNACGMLKPEHITIAMLEKMLWEPCRNYLKLFGIILNSQSFTQTVLCVLFRSVFSFLELFLFGIAVVVAASSSLIVLWLEIEIKEFK